MEDVQAGKPILYAMIFVTLLIALALIIAGCFLVYLGATGRSDLNIFGNTVSTGSVGVVGIFCGTVIGVMNTRRLLLTLERLAMIRR